VTEVILDLPEKYQDQHELLDLVHEEDALCWFWAYPDLIPWERPVIWLYTPVVGNKKWPGDLWGIDCQGELLIVECKQCKRSDDPFVDFSNYHRDEIKEELTASHWMKKFNKHLKAERIFTNCMQERPRGKTDGILPRSNRRAHIRRWPQLGRKIDDYVRSSSYRENAQDYLTTRLNRQNPIPYYLALMVVSNEKSPILTDAAKESGRALITKVGSEHVRVITVKGNILVNNQVRVVAEEIPFESNR